MSDDIFEQAVQIATDSPAHRATVNCDAVRKFIQHGQVDGTWDKSINSAALLCVSQHTTPDGQPVYLALFLYGITLLHLLLAPREDRYVKLPPDGTWGGVEIVG